jgi:HSP20 family protein
MKTMTIRPMIRGEGVGHSAVLSEFNRLLSEVFDAPVFGGLATPRRPVPAMNLWEDASAIHVEAELPGMRIEDVDVMLDGEELTIAGRRKSGNSVGEPREGEPGTGETGVRGAAEYLRRERVVADFSRTVRIAESIDAENVRATLRDGVLHVTLPKSAANNRRRIAVSGGA